MILSDLANVVRRSGLPVVEVPGWKTRGQNYRDSAGTVRMHQFASIEAIIDHHTGTAKSAPGDYPSLKTVRDGRSNLKGLLAQLGLGRSGTVYVIGAGVAWHAGVVFETWQDNWHAIGIEAEHDGVSPWPAAQYEAYVRLNRALVDGYGVPVDHVRGHKEVAKPKGRKPDPIFDMGAMRTAVARLKPGTDTPPSTPTREDDDMWTPAEADKIEKKYTLAHQLWLAQTAAERAVSDAVAAKLVAEGKLSTAQIVAEVEKIWKPVQVTQQQALEKLG